MTTTTPTGHATPPAAMWRHDCGAIVMAPTPPTRCGTCWSALRTGQAHNHTWQPTTAPGQP